MATAVTVALACAACAAAAAAYVASSRGVLMPRGDGPRGDAPQEWIAWALGLGGIAFCAAWSVRIAARDLSEHRIANRDVLVITLGTAVPLTAAALFAGQGSRVTDGLIAALVLGLTMLLIWGIGGGSGRSPLGGGDVKLAPIVAFVPSWLLSGADGVTSWSLFPALAVFGVIGAVVTMRRRGREAALAFAPAMLAAMWFAALVWPWLRGVWWLPAG